MENKIHDCKLNIVDSETCKGKETTNIWCWWCVHPFTNSPFGLPIKFDNNTYQIQGCFCSLNCAKAYNVKENNYRMSEVNSLIFDNEKNDYMTDEELKKMTVSYIESLKGKLSINKNIIVRICI